MAVDFFSFWVESLWGSALLTLFGTGFIYAVIGIMGKMSYFLLASMLMLYFLVFGLGFYGMIFWFPVFLFSMIYFFLQIYKFLQKTD